MAENKKNTSVALAMLAIVVGMVGLAYASVPLYRLFCSVTGLGGIAEQTTELPDVILDRKMTVRFDANVDKKLPWKFEPEQREVTVNIGEEKLAFFWAENMSDKPIKGTSIFNVTPLKAGAFFNKVQCFCFDEQEIKPGERVMFPVSFFVDPDINNEKNLDDVKTITLSYTFFKVKDPS